VLENTCLASRAKVTTLIRGGHDDRKKTNIDNCDEQVADKKFASQMEQKMNF